MISTQTIILTLALGSLIGSILLGFWLRSESWKRRALQERIHRVINEQSIKKAEELSSEQERTDQEALEQWKKNFH